jgi:hypothetical protein
MIEGYVILLGAFSLIFQFLATYFSWRIYSFNKTNKWWLALVFAFVLQAVRRVQQVYYDIVGLSAQNILLDRGLMFLISLLILIGLWSMLKNFENFRVIETKVKTKLKVKK